MTTPVSRFGTVELDDLPDDLRERVGKIAEKFFWSAAPTFEESAQALMTLSAPIASPDPREMSFATTSRFASTKFFVPEASAPGPQFEVPVVMPKVWLPNVPFVVAARIWTAPGWLPNTSEPRPQPATPYCPVPFSPPPVAAGRRGP